MPRSFRKPKTKPPPPPPPLPPTKAEIDADDDNCEPPRLVIHRSLARNNKKKEDQTKQQQHQHQLQQRLIEQKKKQLRKEQQNENTISTKKGTTKKSKDSVKVLEQGVKVNMSPKPEEDEIEVKFTIRRSISGKSTGPAKSVKIRHSNGSRSPSNRSSSSRASGNCEMRRKDPLPPRAPLGGRRSRTASGSSEGARSGGAGSVEVRRYSPEGGEQSPRRTSAVGNETRHKHVGQVTITPNIADRTSFASTAATPGSRPSSYVMMSSYTSPTATIAPGPMLTMEPGKRNSVNQLKSGEENAAFVTIVKKSHYELPIVKTTNGEADTICTSKTNSPYAKPFITVSASGLVRPELISPYDKPDLGEQKVLVKPKLISPYDRPDLGEHHPLLVKPKLTSPYQKPTILIAGIGHRAHSTTSSVRDDVFLSPETPPPDTPPSTPPATPPRTSPYAKPLPPTRTSTLRSSTFSRDAGLRSSFIAPPTPLRNRDEYDEKVETIYAIPTDEEPELYRLTTKIHQRCRL